TEQGKWNAVVAEVKERNEQGQPVLIGTTSVEKSERLSEELKRHGIKHEILNAKNHEREALIIANAGQDGAVTLSTNMAGRGVDDTVPIESGMVTGAITQAQIKVEGRNFDIRKRALEFDDVLNNQRNVIYDQRRKILEKGNVRETVVGFLHDEAAAMVDAHAVSSDPEEWDRTGLAAALGPMLSRADEITATTFADAASLDELREKVGELVDETYERRETNL